MEWIEAAAEALPFADGRFDAVVSQFGCMFFADQPRALREMWRVLRPQGRWAVAVWDALTHWAVAGLALAALVLNAWTTGDHVLRALGRGAFGVAGMDLLLLVAAALAAASAWRLERPPLGASTA